MYNHIIRQLLNLLIGFLIGCGIYQLHMSEIMGFIISMSTSFILVFICHFKRDLILELQDMVNTKIKNPSYNKYLNWKCNEVIDSDLYTLSVVTLLYTAMIFFIPVMFPFYIGYTIWLMILFTYGYYHHKKLYGQLTERIKNDENKLQEIENRLKDIDTKHENGND